MCTANCIGLMVPGAAGRYTASPRSAFSTFTPWGPISALAFAVWEAGFRYDPVQDIIYSKPDAWQHDLGYTWAYDVAAAPLQMIIDCEPFYFKYGGKSWMIELWKGQYGLETGAEIGVYRDDLQTAALSATPKTRFYGCVDPVDELTMSFTLHRRGEGLLPRTGQYLLGRSGDALFQRGPEKHWWLTGFKWGVFTPSTLDLTMDIEIIFPNTEMRDAFKGRCTRSDISRGRRTRIASPSRSNVRV